MQLDAANLTGATGSAGITVTDADTALAAGSGDLPVLATPRMIALMEEASCAALAPALPPQWTSVGIHVDVRHTAPSSLGAVVTARAVVASVSGMRVVFEISASQERDGVRETIGAGTHTRVVVDRATRQVEVGGEFRRRRRGSGRPSSPGTWRCPRARRPRPSSRRVAGA